jgi:hypothetical protein
MYDSERWTFGRTDERRLYGAKMRFLLYVAVYVAWDNKRRDEISSQLGIRKIDKYTKGRNSNRNIYRESHQTELQNNLL